ncbi:MAG: patatin-like phospholipase family protein [Saprospiraceae bacterium]
MKKESKGLFRILSIDGGGIRGILPGQIMVALEEKIQKRTRNPTARIADYFDLIAGTSTGGILSCAYTCPDKDGRPKFTAKEAVDIYLEFGDSIFSTPVVQKVTSIAGLFGPKYPPFVLENLLKEKLGDAKLSQALSNIIIPSFSLDDGDTKFFTSSDAKKNKKDYFMWEVARSTSAAPTYFPAASAGNLRDHMKGFIDGGVFANNPTMCALVEAYKVDVDLHRKYHVESKGIAGMQPDNSMLSNVFVLSLGTSNHEGNYPFDKYADKGVLGWIKPLIDIMMSGVSETVAYQVEQLFRLLRIQQTEMMLDSLPSDGTGAIEIIREELFEVLRYAQDAKKYSKEGDAILMYEPRPQYIRIEPDVGNANSAMDDASKKNLQLLKEAGAAAAKKHDKWLDLVVEQIIQ